MEFYRELPNLSYEQVSNAEDEPLPVIEIAEVTGLPRREGLQVLIYTLGTYIYPEDPTREVMQPRRTLVYATSIKPPIDEDKPLADSILHDTLIEDIRRYRVLESFRRSH